MTFIENSQALKQAINRKNRSQVIVMPPAAPSPSLQIINEHELSHTISRSPSPFQLSSFSSSGSTQTLPLKIKSKQGELILPRIHVAQTSFSISPHTRSGNAFPSRSVSPSFDLTFTDVAYSFPQPPSAPPVPGSAAFSPCPTWSGAVSPLGHSCPPASNASPLSSPASTYEALPKTPVASDEEPVPNFASRRSPLKSRKRKQDKRHPYAMVNEEEVGFLHILNKPVSNASDLLSPPTPKSPYSPTYSSSSCSASSEHDASYDSDHELDSEWYSNEISQIITMSSPHPSALSNSARTRPRQDSCTVPLSSSPCLVAPSPISCSTFDEHFSKRSTRSTAPTMKMDWNSVSGGRRRSSVVPPHQVAPPVPTSPMPALPLATASSPHPPSSFNLRGSANTTNSGSTRRGYTLSRPPPRGSVPEDVLFDDIQQSGVRRDSQQSAQSFQPHSAAYYTYGRKESMPVSPTDSDFGAQFGWTNLDAMFVPTRKASAGAGHLSPLDENKRVKTPEPASSEIHYGYALGSEEDLELSPPHPLDVPRLSLADDVDFPVPFDLDVNVPPFLPVTIPRGPPTGNSFAKEVDLGLQELRAKEIGNVASTGRNTDVASIIVPTPTRSQTGIPIPRSWGNPDKLRRQLGDLPPLQTQYLQSYQGSSNAMARSAPPLAPPFPFSSYQSTGPTPSTAAVSGYFPRSTVTRSSPPHSSLPKIQTSLVSSPPSISPATSPSSARPSSPFPKLKSKWSSSSMATAESPRSRTPTPGAGLSAGAKLRSYFGRKRSDSLSGRGD